MKTVVVRSENGQRTISGSAVIFKNRVESRVAPLPTSRACSCDAVVHGLIVAAHLLLDDIPHLRCHLGRAPRPRRPGDGTSALELGYKRSYALPSTSRRQMAGARRPWW